VDQRSALELHAVHRHPDLCRLSDRTLSEEAGLVAAERHVVGLAEASGAGGHLDLAPWTQRQAARVPRDHRHGDPVSRARRHQVAVDGHPAGSRIERARFLAVEDRKGGGYIELAETPPWGPGPPGPHVLVDAPSHTE